MKTRSKEKESKISNIIEFIKTNKWLHYSIIVLIGLIISIPLLNIQIRDTHDGGLHFLRILGTFNTLKIGEFPPMVAPYYCNGGGYSMNLFYNPLVTYIPMIIKLITPTYMMALKIFASMCIILSGVTMYQFMFHITKKRTIALFSAIIFILSPYKLGDVYRRYAIGEFASFIFMPILFTGIYSLFNEDGKKHFLITVGASGLLLTHTITTFYMAIFSALYVLFNIKKLKDIEIIKKLIINVIFILLISTFFIMPMVEARLLCDYSIFDSEIMSTNGPYVYVHTIGLKELFSHKIVTEEDTVYSVGIPIFILFVLSIITYRKVDKKYKDLYLVFIIYSIISLYMCTRFCPWMVFPNILCKLQYPWRMLGFYNFFGSLIAGINLYIIIDKLFKKDIIKIIASVLFVILLIVYNLPMIYQFKATDTDLDNKYEEFILNDIYIGHFQINREYLPIKALKVQRNYLLERDYNKIEILDGYCEISNEVKENLTFKADIKDAQKGTILEIPFFYYPGYEIEIVNGDNEVIYTKAVESEYGFASVILDEDIENGQIIVEYKGTVITKVSYIISIISIIIFIAYVAKQERNNKIEEKNAKNKKGKE